MSQLEKNIALNLKRIRKSHHMSLDMMAEKTGVSKSMLGQIERGESNPTISTIGKIVEEHQTVRFHATQNYFYKNHGKTPLLLQVVISHEQISAY